MFLHRIHHHWKRLHQKLLRRLNIAAAFFVSILITGILFLVGGVLASTGVNFTLIINPASLAVSIVNANYQPVTAPAVPLSYALYGDTCQSNTGTLGTTTQRIYVTNPRVANNGWSVTLAALDPTATWVSGSQKMDFNDPTTTGCTDGADVDTVAGQLTLDPTSAILTAGQCLSCVADHIQRWSVASFEENITDSITLLTGTPSSDDMGDWVLRGVEVTQTVPAFQPAAGEYTLPLSFSIIAQ